MRRRGVLIVDDDPRLNLVLASMLEQDDVPCRCVNTTREGLSTIAMRVPAAVIVDLRLSNPSTIDFCKVLRTSQATSDIPILLISGAEEQEIVQAVNEIASTGDRSTPVDWIMKPFTMSQLRDKLAEIVGSREWIKG